MRPQWRVVACHVHVKLCNTPSAHGPQGMDLGVYNLFCAAWVQRLRSMPFADKERSQQQSHKRLGTLRAV